MILSQHTETDILAYVFFVAGQSLFLLKRAGSAVRNPTANIKTRWQFFNLNWDTFAIRAIFESPIYLIVRHFGLGQAAALVGWTVPQWLTLGDNPLPFFFIGIAADSLIDWAALSPKMPAFLRGWLGENVPKFDTAVKLQETLDKAQAETKEAVVHAGKAADAVATAQQQVPAAVPAPVESELAPKP